MVMTKEYNISGSIVYVSYDDFMLSESYIYVKHLDKEIAIEPYDDKNKKPRELLITILGKGVSIDHLSGYVVTRREDRIVLQLPARVLGVRSYQDLAKKFLENPEVELLKLLSFLKI